MRVAPGLAAAPLDGPSECLDCPFGRPTRCRPSGKPIATLGAGVMRVLDSAALGEGARHVVDVGAWRVALARVGGVVYAIDNVCPHRGGELGLGDLQGYHLYCPQHAWCFDVRTGEGFFPHGIKVRRFDVTERDGGIYVAEP